MDRLDYTKGILCRLEAFRRALARYPELRGRVSLLQDDEGILILSEFAGAAAQLGRGALLVNPYDTEGVADAIHRGCRMSDDQRRARMRRLRRSIRRNDVFRWADAFLRAALAEGVSAASSPARKLRLVAGTIGDLHRFAGPDMAIRPPVCTEG